MIDYPEAQKADSVSADVVPMGWRVGRWPQEGPSVGFSHPGTHCGHSLPMIPCPFFAVPEFLWFVILSQDVAWDGAEKKKHPDFLGGMWPLCSCGCRTCQWSEI